MINDAASFLSVFTRDGSFCRVDVSEEGIIDAAVTRYADSGKYADSVLHLSLAFSPGVYRVLASEITSWLDSTPESRAASRQLDELMKEPGWQDEDRE